MSQGSQGRAFFVLGPESSGTRLATEILINAGCHGSSDHIQPLDDPQFDLATIPIDTPVVWRRSFPHNNEIPNIADMLDRVEPRRVKAIVTVRDWYSVQQSQVRDAQHASTVQQADGNIAIAYRLIFSVLNNCYGVQFRVLAYESLILHEQAQTRFLESLGLTVPTRLVSVRDGNSKYYVGDV